MGFIQRELERGIFPLDCGDRGTLSERTIGMANCMHAQQALSVGRWTRPDGYKSPSDTILEGNRIFQSPAMGIPEAWSRLSGRNLFTLRNLEIIATIVFFDDDLHGTAALRSPFVGTSGLTSNVRDCRFFRVFSRGPVLPTA